MEITKVLFDLNYFTLFAILLFFATVVQLQPSPDDLHNGLAGVDYTVSHCILNLLHINLHSLEDFNQNFPILKTD